MVLIGLALRARCHHALVGQKLQVQPHLATQQPHERVHPAEGGEQFGEQDVQGVPLLHVRPFVDHDFLQLLLGLRLRVHENPAEERERAGGVAQIMQRNLAPKGFSLHGRALGSCS